MDWQVQLLCLVLTVPYRLLCRLLQDFLLPAGVVSPNNSSVLAAGTWLNPDDPLLSQIPPMSTVNRCSPGALVAVIYFCSFVLLCGLVLVNFVIGVIIDNMQSSKTSDDMAVSRYHVEQFVKVGMQAQSCGVHWCCILLTGSHATATNPMSS